MIHDQLTLVKKAPLPFLLSLPKGQSDQPRKWPLLCFLHGLEEGPPTDIFTGITAHGPLRQGNSPLATEQFIVAAPQLPTRGDNWHLHADAVMEMVHMVQEDHGADPHRTYGVLQHYYTVGYVTILIRAHDVFYRPAGFGKIAA